MKKILFIVAITALVSSGCEEAVSVSQDNTPIALSVSSASFSAATTKSSTTLISGNIGVFLGSANGYVPLNNFQYTCTSGVWKRSSGDDICLKSKAASVCAYYPYNSSITNSSSVPLQSQAYTETSDLCYATYVTGLVNTSPSVSFDMVRAYSRITFAITRDASYPFTCAVSSISIANSRIKTQTSLDITTGTYTAETIGSVSYNPQIASIAESGTTATGVLLIPVSGLTGNIDLTFTVDGHNLTASLPVSTTGLDNLAAGVNYKIAVTMKGTLVTIGSVTVTDWTDKSGTNQVSVLN